MQVALPMNATGDHWVTVLIDLHNSSLLVLDSMHSLDRCKRIRAHILKWTEHLNQCLEELGHFARTGRGYYNFDFHYNDDPQIIVPQQENSMDCGVITCWLIHEFVSRRWPPFPVTTNVEGFFSNVRHTMARIFYSCRCECTSLCGYD